MSPPLAVVALAVGLCIGSYAGTTAVRAAQGESALTGRSRCDGCGLSLGLLRTVPVVSFVSLGGRCGACGARIDPFHVVSEVLGGALLAVPVLLFPLGKGLTLAALGEILLASALVDFKTLRLPDALTLAAAAVGVGLAWLQGLDRLLLGLACGAIAFVVLEGARRTFAALRGRSGLGFGDVKLTAALAIWLGPLTVWALVLACAAGLVQFVLTRPGNGKIAFGPAIAASAFGLGLIQEALRWPSLS